MRITIESTENFRFYDGRYYRLWKGKDEKGQDVAAWVLGIAFQEGADISHADLDLRTVPMSGLEQTIACTRNDISPPLKKSKKSKSKKS